jgi:hypothetical protein
VARLARSNEAAVNLFAEAISGSCPAEELETATLFFGWLIKDLSNTPEGEPLNCDASSLLKNLSHKRSYGDSFCRESLEG